MRLRFIEHTDSQTRFEVIDIAKKPILRNNGFNAFCNMPKAEVINSCFTSKVYGEGEEGKKFWGFDGKHGWVELLFKSGEKAFLFASRIRDKKGCVLQFS